MVESIEREGKVVVCKNGGVGTKRISIDYIKERVNWSFQPFRPTALGPPNGNFNEGVWPSRKFVEGVSVKNG